MTTLIVWQPMLGGKRKHVAAATKSSDDQRARHLWDGHGYTIRAYKTVLGIDEDAWDISMVYGPEAQWDGDLPPKPAYWMHQLKTAFGGSRVDGPLLNSRHFATKVRSHLVTDKSRPNGKR